MESLAIVLVLVSSLIHATKDFFTKRGGDKRVFIWWYETFAMLFFMPFFLYYILTEELNPIGIYIGLGVGIVHVLYWTFTAKSYEAGDFSHVYPIIRSSPALVLIFSVLLLHEEVSILGAVGVVLTTVGIYLLHVKKIGIKEFFEPISSILRVKETQLALLTLITVTTYSIIDKVGVKYISPFLYSYLLNFSALALFTPYVFSTRSKTQIKKEWRSNWKTILPNGIFTFLGYLLVLIAFTIEKASYVVGLRSISIIFGVILGGYVLNEGKKITRLVGAIIIFVGALLISLAK